MPSEQTTTKKSLLIFSIFIIILGLSVITPASWFGVKPKKYTKLDFSNITPIDTLAKDNDSNTIPDWKDMLLNDMSPTTQNLASKATIDPKIQERLDDPSNLTASFSKNIYVASTYLKQNGGATSQGQQDIIASLMAEEAKKITTKTYSLSDLAIAKTESVATKKQYGNNLGTLLKKSAGYKFGEGDAAIVQAYATSKDTSILEAFVIKRDRLDTIIASLIAMSVPPSATPYHLLVLNRMSEYRATLDNLSKLAEDPVRASISFNEYLPVIKALFGAIFNLREYFIVENITFTQQEAGHLFMQWTINQ
jgi:hypothetical protein